MRVQRLGYGFWHKRQQLAGFFTFATLIACSTITVGALVPISQQFLSRVAVPLGSLVSLESTSSSYVVAASPSTTGNLLGVAIAVGDSPVSISTGQSNPVQVATNGVVPVLVSTINGVIHSGDSITASPIGGVGMKATSNIKVIGIAQSDLTTSEGNTNTQTYTDKHGQKHSILLGEIPLLVSISYYYRQPDKTIIPSALQNIANAVASKPVNAVPIIVSSAIFLVTLAIVVTLAYAMIRSSIISVGRNPMAQSAVYRNVLQLSGVIIAILSVAIVAIYLILTKF